MLYRIIKIETNIIAYPHPMLKLVAIAIRSPHFTFGSPHIILGSTDMCADLGTHVSQLLSRGAISNIIWPHWQTSAVSLSCGQHARGNKLIMPRFDNLFHIKQCHIVAQLNHQRQNIAKIVKLP